MTAMDRTYVTVRTTGRSGSSADVTELCRSITWSGDYRNAARTLSFSPVVSDVDTKLPRIETDLGSSAQLWHGNELLMDAYSLERVRDSMGTTVDVTAYDRGLYLTRNNCYIRVSGQTAEGVTAVLCREFGIETGALAPTGVALTRNFFGVSLYKTIMTMYTLAGDQTGKKYLLRFRGTKLEVVELALSEESILLRPGSNLLSCTVRESASAMTNSVAIYDDQCRRLQTRQDSEAVALYGLMQAAIKSSSGDDPVARADQMLKENGLKTTITLNALGNLKLITGNACVVEEPVTGTCGLFWIISDTHTWSRGLYQTRVTLSLEALMDKQTAGSLPTK